MAQIDINQAPPTSRKPFVIVPIGMFCNVELQNAVKGTEINFWQGTHCKMMILVDKVTIAIKTPLFSFLVRSLYGKEMSIRELIEQWEIQCIEDGLGIKGFDHEKALLIEVL